MEIRRVVNLTGRELTLIDDFDGSVDLPSHGRAKVFSRTEVMYEIELEGVMIPVLAFHEQEILQLPEAQEGVLYVVSGLVASAAQREDVVTPSRVNRDNDGRIVSASALMIPFKPER